MRRRFLTFAVMIFVLNAGIALAADPVTVGRLDFDQLKATPAGQKMTTPLVFPDVNGTGINVTIEGPALIVTDLFEFAHLDDIRGNALITNIWPQQDGISIKFSRPVQTVGIIAGDFGGDEDGPLVLRAFDCKGRVVGRASAPWNDGQMPPFAPLTLSADSICQVVFTSGGEFAGSAFLDDLTFSGDLLKPHQSK